MITAYLVMLPFQQFIMLSGQFAIFIGYADLSVLLYFITH